MRRARVHVYRDRRGEYRWRLRAANGRIIADSGEGYTTAYAARRAWARLDTLVLNGVTVTDDSR